MGEWLETSVCTFNKREEGGKGKKKKKAFQTLLGYFLRFLGRSVIESEKKASRKLFGAKLSKRDGNVEIFLCFFSVSIR